VRKSWPLLTTSAVAAVLTAALIPGGNALAGAGGWSIQPSPNPAGTTDAELAAVACTGPRACLSVGDYTGSNGYLTLAERWNGTNWSRQPTPNPAGDKNDILRALSCAGPRWCVAVGYAFSARSAESALVEAWNGRAWAIQPTPPVTGPAGGAGLDGVSCTAPDSCLAVGGFTKPGVYAQEQPLAEYWNGSAWAIVAVPNPHAENGSLLAGVSCTAASVCTAGGDYDYADIAQSVFALRWNGTTWARQHQPNPRGQDANGDNAVSCASAAACTSVGYWTNGGNVGETLAEAWNGTTWARQRSPNPAGNAGAALDGVSCPHVTACTAVGNWTASTSGSPTDTLAEHWNGTRWSVQSTPDPAGAKISALSGVACLPAGTCVAVGSFWNGTSTQTLAESRAG
jgi:hypothetical protein